MTIEEKAKRYDEALEIAKKNYITALDLCEGSQIGVECFKNTLESIFPELKESEDERILELIKKYIHYNISDMALNADHITREQLEDWLEKQGESNPYSGVSFKYNGHTWGMCARDNGVEILVDGEIKERVFLGNKPQGKSVLETRTDNELVEEVYSHLDSIKETADRMTSGNFMHNKAAIKFSANTITKVLELIGIKAQKDSKYDNQNCVKPSDKVKPKFKIGDWITNGEYTWKVISVDYLDYTLQNQWGECVEDTVDYVNKAFHLWTIQDAKDGDVIAFDNGTIVIFKDLYNSTSFHSYCYIECGIFDFNKDELPDWWEGEGFNPSTKEQSDILFQKMKEAGYVWDTDKKELRKEKIK